MLPPAISRLALGAPIAALTLAVLATVMADEPGRRLTPVEATARSDDRVDPMRPVRLTAQERARLYDQAARDAEPLELQAMQLRRLASLMVLFVCTGNTCRSPMAETIFRQLMAERLGCGPDEIEEHGVVVASAGVAASSEERTIVESRLRCIMVSPVDST